MAEELWYYEKDGEQHGPVTEAELRALIETGEISRTNLAWKPGERDWVETGSYEILLPSFRTPPPMQAAPPPMQAAPPPMPPKPPPPAVPAPVAADAGTSSGTAAADEPKRPLSFALTLSKSEVSLPTPTPDPVAPTSEPLTAELVEPTQQLPPVPTAPSYPQTQPAPQGPIRVHRTPLDRLNAVVMLLANAKSLIGAGAGVALVVVVGWWFFKERNPPPLHPTQKTLHGIVVPAGYRGPVGQLKVDAYPWAELSRLKRGDKTLDVPGSLATPLVLLVAPGSYQVELGNFSCEVDIAEGVSRTCQKIVRTVDAMTYYQEVGW